MHYMATADTDTGLVKEINQDSLLIKHGICEQGEVVLAVICDGMGGLAKGELASAEVIRAFAAWFDQKLEKLLAEEGITAVLPAWTAMLRELNTSIGEYGKYIRSSLGTTFTGILMVDDQFVAAHIGDTRLYHIGSDVSQMTKDQTFVAREIAKGTMTLEQAKRDYRRNMLLQCIGASDEIEPENLSGRVEAGTYLLCSDGFRHENSEMEMLQAFQAGRLPDRDAMHRESIRMIEQAKRRKERDNISVILIKAVREG